MRLHYLKVPSIICKMQVLGWGFFFIYQVVIGQAAPARAGAAPIGSSRSAGAYPAFAGSPGLPPQASDSAEVGDIVFDPSIDDPTFRVCDAHHVFQYYNTGSYFLDHKKEIGRYFTSHYKPGSDTANQTGYLTIRFIINCSGETGRFRLFELDGAYQSFRFNKTISGQLLTLVRQWKGWRPAVYKDKVYDSYQYITFTMKKGRVVCITP